MSSALAIQTSAIPERPPGQDDLPYHDGAPLESDKHRRQMTLLISVLRRHLRDRPDTFVGGNLGLYYNLLQVARGEVVVPDVMVVLGCELQRERKSWVVWEEGVGPSVVIELLSASTAKNDRTRKKVIYGKTGNVAEYVLFDPLEGTLEAFRLGPDRSYVPLPTEAGPSVPSELLGLRLVVWHGPYEDHDSFWLRWADAEGRVLPTDEELAQAAQSRAEAAQSRAEAAQSRAERLAAQLLALGITPVG